MRSLSETRTKMSRFECYKGKLVAQTEWWVHSCDLPELRWGRLRVFHDEQPIPALKKVANGTDLRIETMQAISCPRTNMFDSKR